MNKDVTVVLGLVSAWWFSASTGFNRSLTLARSWRSERRKSEMWVLIELGGIDIDKGPQAWQEQAASPGSQSCRSVDASQ